MAGRGSCSLRVLCLTQLFMLPRMLLKNVCPYHTILCQDGAKTIGTEHCELLPKNRTILILKACSLTAPPITQTDFDQSLKWGLRAFPWGQFYMEMLQISVFGMSLKMTDLKFQLYISRANELTYLPVDKMAAILQTIFSDTFSWRKPFCIFIKLTLKLITKGPIDNNPALVQIMAWRRIGAKP